MEKWTEMQDTCQLFNGQLVNKRIKEIQNIFDISSQTRGLIIRSPKVKNDVLDIDGYDKHIP